MIETIKIIVMKKLLVTAICLIFLCSFQNEKAVVQSVTEQIEKTSNQTDNERIQALITRVTGEWSAAGYSIMSYSEFQIKRLLPENVMARFYQNFLRYANKEYGGENTSFVIYKGSCYELQVIEDCAGQCFPNRYYMADSACN